MRSEARSEEELMRMSEIWEELTSDLDGLVARMSNPDHLVRMQVATKLRLVEDPAAVEPLLKLLGDEHPEVRSSAALTLGRYKDPSSLPALIDHMLHDPNPKARGLSIFAVGCFGTDEAMRAMVAALDDPDEHLRYAACFQFANNNDKRAVDKIRSMLSDPDTGVRGAAGAVLVRLALVDDQVMAFLDSEPSWEARHLVAEDMVRAGVADERIVKAVERLIREPEGREYDAMVAAYEETIRAMECEEPCDGEELCEEDERALAEMEEDIGFIPLPELLQRARDLLEEQENKQ